LSPKDFLAALPQFTTAQVRQTVTAGMGQIGWIDEQLLTTDAEKTAFRAKAGEIYRARLNALGLSPKDGEADDDRLLRASLVNFYADTVHDKPVRDAMNKQGRAVLGLGGDGALHADAVPKDLRGVALRVAVQEGGKEAFDAAEKHFRASQDPTIRSQMLAAMGSTEDAQLTERARALVFEKGLLRRNEIFPIVGGQTAEAKTRPALRQWVDAHFSELEARLAPAGAALVGLYSAGMCSEAEASDVEARFADRMKSIEGGPLELKQTAEAIRLCSAQKNARKGAPLASK